MSDEARTPTIIEVYGKCSDMCHVSVFDEEGNELLEHDGYVPRGLGIGGGDDIQFRVDARTGQILDWKPITAETLEGINEQ